MHARFSRTSHVLAALLTLYASSVYAQSSRTAASGKRAATADSAAAYFTDAQATRGDKVFSANCLSCHARKDMSSPDFQLKWNGRTVFDLFDRVQTTMPESDPGSLSASEYADVVAYLLKMNGMRAGKTAIAPNAAMRQQKLVFSAR